MPLVVRHLAQTGRVGVCRVLRACLHALVAEFGPEVEAEVERDLRGNRMAVYESRAQLFVHAIADLERTFAVIERVVAADLVAQGAGDLVESALAVLELDRAFCPRSTPAETIVVDFDFAADRAAEALGAMQAAAPSDLDRSAGESVALEIRHPGLVGTVLVDPDGGSWMRGRTVGVRRGSVWHATEVAAAGSPASA
jgi:hypothetical protein